jgi:hypothetical protein
LAFIKFIILPIEFLKFVPPKKMSEEESIENNETFEEEEFNEVESFKLAQRLQKDKKFQEAADIYSELCEYRSVKYGEESYEVADMYYLYGDVLLSHCLSSEGKIFF